MGGDEGFDKVLQLLFRWLYEMAHALPYMAAVTAVEDAVAECELIPRACSTG
jgi:hypothetical protein